ncbi:hypothetical protein ACFZAD_39215 [Streptomyces iakyrus]
MAWPERSKRTTPAWSSNSPSSKPGHAHGRHGVEAAVLYRRLQR